MALHMWARARRQIQRTGIPDGRIVYQDTDRRHNVDRPLVSPSCGLTGKPDYLVEAANGLIPVELKSRNCPRSGPHEGDVAQVTAYRMLVEDTFGSTTASRDYSVCRSLLAHPVFDQRPQATPSRFLTKMRETRQFSDGSPRS